MRIFVSLPEAYGHSEALLERATRLVLEREQVAAGELSITCLPDEPIRRLNQRWLGHDWVPDVLAFALHEEGDAPLGDIYIGVEQAMRQAAEHDVPVGEELARLAIHGTLHVLGYDHPEAHEDRPDSDLYVRQERLVRDVLGVSRSADADGSGR